MLMHASLLRHLVCAHLVEYVQEVSIDIVLLDFVHLVKNTELL
jgi:hypothetical protein